MVVSHYRENWIYGIYGSISSGWLWRVVQIRALVYTPSIVSTLCDEIHLLIKILKINYETQNAKNIIEFNVNSSAIIAQNIYWWWACFMVLCLIWLKDSTRQVGDCYLYFYSFNNQDDQGSKFREKNISSFSITEKIGTYVSNLRTAHFGHGYSQGPDDV